MDEWVDSDDDSVNSSDEQEIEKKKKGMIYILILFNDRKFYEMKLQYVLFKSETVHYFI